MPTVVAFEAGEWDQHRHEGWTVHFIGKAQAVVDHQSAEIAAMGLASWIDGEPAVYVRITAEMVSGVQVGAVLPDVEGDGGRSSVVRLPSLLSAGAW